MCENVRESDEVLFFVKDAEFKKSGCILFCICMISTLAICSGCQSANAPGSKQPDGVPGEAVPEAIDGSGKVTPESVEPPEEKVDVPQDSPCKGGGNFVDGQCVCGAMQYDPSIESQWACIGETKLRCMKKTGCTWNDKVYPVRSEIREQNVFCGEVQIPQNPEGYICAYQDSRYDWLCDAATCDCNGVSIQKDKVCVVKGESAENGGIYKTQADKDKNDPVCGEIHYSEIPVDYKKRFHCEKDKWTCDGELICAKGQWFCVKEGYENALLCKNLCAHDSLYKTVTACNQTKDEDDRIIACESLDGWGPNTRYDEIGGAPTCHGYLGGYCRYGVNLNTEAETCQPWDFAKFGGKLSNKAYDQYSDFGLMHGNVWLEEAKDTVCVEGHCPCGDGFCPQYAYCDGGECYCGDSNIGTKHGEFYCEIRIGSTQTEWSIDYTHTIECRNPKGCDTADGKHHKNGDVLCTDLELDDFCEYANDYGDYAICDMHLKNCRQLAKADKIAANPQKTDAEKANPTDSGETDNPEAKESPEVKQTPEVEICRKGFMYDEMLQRCVYVINGFAHDKNGKTLSSLAAEYSNAVFYQGGTAMADPNAPQRMPYIRRCVEGDVQDDVCHCGDKNIDDLVTHDCAVVDGKGYEICALSTGCACGDVICPNTTACVDGQCVDPITHQPMGPSLPAPACKDGAHCACGTKTCSEGDFCYHDQCREHFYASLRDGKRRVFNLDEVFSYLLDDDNSTAEKIFNYSDYLYLDTEASEGYVIYATPECKYDYRDNECGSDEFCIVTGGPSGDECLRAEWGDPDIRCDLPGGCACGDSICAWGGICNDGKCKYDYFYREHWFGRGTVDANGNGVCAETLLSPQWGADYEKSYLCTGLGWMCRDNEGCTCGDTKCALGSVCIHPGVCFDGVEPCEKDLDDKGQCCNGVIDGQGECCASGVLVDSHSCCESGVVGKKHGVWGWEECCKTGVRTAFGQCCPKELLGKDGQCLCEKYIDDDSPRCHNRIRAKYSGYVDVLNANGYQCPEEFVENGECHCKVLAESGQCCPLQYIGADGQCQCKGMAGWSLNECCEYGIDDTGYKVRCKGKTKSKSYDACMSGVVDETGSNSGYCCTSGVQNDKGGCCPQESVGDDGKCQCLVDEFGQCGEKEALPRKDIKPDIDKNRCKTGVVGESGYCCPEHYATKEGTCTCLPDWWGECCVGILDRGGQCCESEVLDHRGWCCDDGKKNRFGWCCEDVEGECIP